MVNNSYDGGSTRVGVQRVVIDSIRGALVGTSGVSAPGTLWVSQCYAHHACEVAAKRSIVSVSLEALLGGAGHIEPEK